MWDQGALCRGRRSHDRALDPLARLVRHCRFVALALFRVTPSGFLPDEDQGYFITVVQLPDGASKKRTVAVLDKVEGYFLSIPAVYGTDALVGQNFVFNTRGT